ncbi:hypothetical protein [Streptobacillus canis]|uniref:hypothetical protein n=1 Tax=Streptobacillus canis TaxID=2678686 RepID=UPI0012E19C25|nr:hypothetical protein [Streptobacillus canis]
MIAALLKKTNFEYLLEGILNILPFTFILNLIPFLLVELSLTALIILAIIFILQVYLLFKLSDIVE